MVNRRNRHRFKDAARDAHGLAQRSNTLRTLRSGTHVLHFMGNLLQHTLIASVLVSSAASASAQAGTTSIQYEMVLNISGKDGMRSPTIRTIDNQKASLSWGAGKDAITVEVTPHWSKSGIATLLSFRAYGDSFGVVMRDGFKVAFSTDKNGHLSANVTSLASKQGTHIVLGTNTRLSGATLMVQPSAVNP